MPDLELIPTLFSNYDNCLVIFKPKQYDLLLQSGRISVQVPNGLRTAGNGLALLAGPPEEDWYNLHAYPDEALDQLLEHARWIKPGRLERSEIVLADPAPLRLLLQRRLAAAHRQIERVSLADFRGELSRCEDIEIDDYAADTLRATGRWLGLLGVCNCGEESCTSLFAWIEDGIVKLLVTTKGLELFEIEVLPCRLELEDRPHRS